MDSLDRTSQSQGRAYRTPQLTVLGEVCHLTESGSMNGRETNAGPCNLTQPISPNNNNMC